MKKFIFLTFAFLAWAFYEMSGGDEFQPQAAVAAEEPVAEVVSTSGSEAAVNVPVAAKAEPIEPQVTRASFTNPNVALSKPSEDQLAALDPEVLDSFAAVLKDEPQPVAADGGLVAGKIALDLREVSGNRVNMRNGPGTNFSIVDRLTRGEQVEVLAEPGNGWLKLRVSDSGRVGWMADFLVTAAAE